MASAIAVSRVSTVSTRATGDFGTAVGQDACNWSPAFCAAWAEDQGGEARLADIRNRFGDRVADIVHACSDSVVNTAAGQQKEDWRTRKMRYIDHLKTVDRETCLVSLSDKAHNARSILRDLRKPQVGPAVWSRFGKRPKEDTLWYYRELANTFQGLLPGQLAEELMEIVIVLENE